MRLIHLLNDNGFRTVQEFAGYTGKTKQGIYWIFNNNPEKLLKMIPDAKKAKKKNPPEE